MKKIIFGLGLALALTGCMKKAAPAASGAHAGMACCAMKDGKTGCDEKNKDSECAKDNMACCKTASAAPAASATPAPAK
ncbi:MAG TPA: lipoprotein [bacterium]|nr:lipoprotein [bacterium]